MLTNEFPIDRLIFNDRVWPRLRRDEARVAHLADVLTAGGGLPPVKIQRGSSVVLGGWHTVAAYRRLARAFVPVEVVDVPDADQLLYAYREDAEAALPYSADDVRSVARRLYAQRANGQAVNVEQLAHDLGRARKTVADWVADLVAADTERATVLRGGRALASLAFTSGAGCTQRRTAELLGVAQKTVSNDGGSATATHLLADERTVEAAHALIAESASRGSTADERRDAVDWILGQTDPEALAIAKQSRALAHALEWTRSIVRQLQGFDLPALADVAVCPDLGVRENYQELVAHFATIRELLEAIERRTQ